MILFSASVLKLKHGEQNKHNCHDLVNQARNHNQTQNSICLGVWGKLIAAISLAHGAELQPARPSVLSTRLEPETHAGHSWKSTKFCSPPSGPLQAHVCWCLHWAFHHLLSLFFWQCYTVFKQIPWTIYWFDGRSTGNHGFTTKYRGFLQTFLENQFWESVKQLRVFKLDFLKPLLPIHSTDLKCKDPNLKRHVCTSSWQCHVDLSSIGFQICTRCPKSWELFFGGELERPSPSMVRNHSW